MPSNGLTKRRRTLKRPIVCKSPKANCGACTLQAQLLVDFVPPGSLFIIEMLIPCDPDPEILAYTVEQKSPFISTPPSLLLVANVPTGWQFLAPLTEDIYRVFFTAVNSQKCRLLFDMPIRVSNTP